MIATRRDLVSYMAPEQTKPSLFNRTDTNARKASDVHSFAMTAYEVRFPLLPIGQLRTLHRHQVLTGIRPYANNGHSGQIIRLAAGSSRIPRPSQDIVGPWLPDSVWEMLECCWAPYPWARWRTAEAYQTLLRSADDVKSTKDGKCSLR